MKILVNTPHLYLTGGVSNHYKGLKPYWNEKVYYNQIGRHSEKAGRGIYWLPFDVIKFIIKIILLRPDIVLLNPSLGKNAIERDFLFLKIAKFLGKKVVVFFHGFNTEFIKKTNIERFKYNLNKCECIFVLANEFANILKGLGINVPIHLTSTKVDDRLVDNFEINIKRNNINNVLFLARIEKEKGIYIALDTVKVLQNKGFNIIFRIAGIGGEFEKAKQYAIDNTIKAEFLGNVSGASLINEYKKAGLYILPTYHEGMPTSVLEAMAFGLPVITRPVGGLCDFFIDGKMGRLIDSFEPQDYADAIASYISNPTQWKETSVYNHEYAMKHFLASSVAKNVEKILKGYL